jgi:hypothetical protein
MRISTFIILFAFVFSVSFVSSEAFDVGVSLSPDDIDFSVSPSFVKTLVKKGEIVNNVVSVENIGEAQQFYVEFDSFIDFATIENGVFNLETNEDEEFTIVLDGVDQALGVFVGKIIVTGEINVFELPFVFEVESKNPRFDVVSEISLASSDLTPGEELVVDVTVYNIEAENDAAILEFYVSDEVGNIIVSDIQNLDVSDQVQITKNFEIPADTNLGNHIFYTYVRQEGSVGISSSSFRVTLPEPILDPPVVVESKSRYRLLSFFIIAVLIVSFLIINFYWNKRLKGNVKYWNEKVVDIKRIRLSDTAKEISKLNYQNNLLERAYGKGYVKKDSYDTGRKKINSLIRELKKRL